MYLWLRRLSGLRRGATPTDPFTALGSLDFSFPAGWGHQSLEVLPYVGNLGDLDPKTLEARLRVQGRRRVRNRDISPIPESEWDRWPETGASASLEPT